MRARRYWNEKVLSTQLKATRTPSMVGIDAVGAWIAHPVTHFSSMQALASHLDLVCDALEAVGVEYVVLDAEPNRRRTVVITTRHSNRAMGALEAGLADRGVYFRDVSAGKREVPRLVGPNTLPRGATNLRFFRVLSSPNGDILSKEGLACVVQVWQVTERVEPAGPSGEMAPKGSWVAAPPGNAWADVVTPVAQQIEYVEIDGRPRPVLSEAAVAPRADSITFPIDVVYTWVDGSDPDWQRSKAETLSGLVNTVALNAFAANASRFESRDELRYSLRSLDMYAGWVRHVYIVTDRQTPPWLDLSNPRLSVIDHRELFEERGRLPTFNSHAIETQIHHIKGLSEQFIYLNDDVFFARPVEPRRFFLSNGTALSFPSRARIGFGPSTVEDTPVTAAAKNARRLVTEALGQQPMNKFKHVPHCLRRSVLLEIEQRFPVEHAATASAQFRTRDDVPIPSSLAHHYGYLTGRTTPGNIRYVYADIARPETEGRLQSLLRRRDWDVFCLNDHDSSGVDPESQTRMLRNFLESYFPLGSTFELPGIG